MNWKTILILYLILMVYNHFIVDSIAYYFEVTGETPDFQSSDWEDLLGLLIIAPFLEELIFRAYLSGYVKHYLFIVIPIIISSLLNFSWIIWIILFSGALITLFYMESINGKDGSKISKKLLYLSILFISVLFAFSHLKTIEGDSDLNRYLVVLMAFVPGGIFLSCIRLEKGLWTAMLFHSLINFTVLSLNSIL
ncbi:CPBP family glutamic-type intramembrane protease [Echinicola salinicaeni]|uniref:CPBP family glutamic-type intramembrane protease n=1 Tax=Echinicola salinicaeni TaxID=2762757 RepID=UPI00164674C0|nr:CPBP family glutamic-type intramembrane protease [Echinicola salinicaeni]